MPAFSISIVTPLPLIDTPASGENDVRPDFTRLRSQWTEATNQDPRHRG